MKKSFPVAVMALLLSASLAFAALDLGSAKSQGLVGEQPDGLIGAVQSTPDALALVRETNAERLERYAAIAAKNGTDVSKVQALAGKKLVEQAPAGEYVLVGGKWTKK